MSEFSSVDPEFVKQQLTSFQQGAEEIITSEKTKATTDQLSKTARTVIESIITFCHDILASDNQEEE